MMFELQKEMKEEITTRERENENLLPFIQYYVLHVAMATL